ncbi:MAG: DUF4255 domain-containing protein [Actinomycetota bacterium]|nr:DUF4255 domain-containing protein [Actinomycetota bacterium]MDG2122027.1 DUF4255 domain-containing protein [Actinomycetota bacterium]
MIHLIDDALERFLKHEVLEESSIEVSFNRPDGEWVSSLTSPVINIFLWRIRKDHVKNSSGTEVRSGNETVRRMVPPRLRLSYFVSAHAQEVRDEHLLLGEVAREVLRNKEMPEEFKEGDLAGADAPVWMSVGNESLQLPLEFWQAIGGDLKSGIDLEISVPIDLELGVEVGPPVEGIELRTEDIHSPTIKSVRSYVRGESNDG